MECRLFDRDEVAAGVAQGMERREDRYSVSYRAGRVLFPKSVDWRGVLVTEEGEEVVVLRYSLEMSSGDAVVLEDVTMGLDR